MIVVDTSALMAILLGEPEADACIEAVAGEREVAISAVTVAEALIVAARRDVAEEMRQLIDELAPEVAAVSAATAARVAAAYAKWGKGRSAAGLNFGDCFAYAAAAERACPLLFVGRDFARTDARPAIRATRPRTRRS